MQLKKHTKFRSNQIKSSCLYYTIQISTHKIINIYKNELIKQETYNYIIEYR